MPWITTECETLNSLGIPGILSPMGTMGTVEIVWTLSLICCFQSPNSPLVDLDCCLWNEKIHIDLVFTRYFGCRKQKSTWTHWNERFIKRNGHTSWTPWKKMGDCWKARILPWSAVWTRMINKINMVEPMHQWGSEFSGSSGVKSKEIGVSTPQPALLSSPFLLPTNKKLVFGNVSTGLHSPGSGPPWSHGFLNLVVCHSRRESTWPVESDPSTQSMMSTERHFAVTAGHPARKWNMRDSQVSCCGHLSEGPLGKWLGAAVTHSRHLWDVGNPPVCASQQLIIRSSLCTPAQMEMCRE